MTFKPGQSGNPSGRPKGAAGLAKYIAEQTDDGRELVDKLLLMARDTAAPARAAAAIEALLDRLAGKPMQSSEVRALNLNLNASASSVTSDPTWHSMTPDQRLAALEAHRADVLARHALEGADRAGLLGEGDEE